MQTIKKLGVLSTAKMTGLFGLILGIISVILSKVICSMNPVVAVQYGMNCAVLTWPAMLMAIVFAGIMYFIAGLVLAALYNLFASWIGGIKIDLTNPKK